MEKSMDEKIEVAKREVKETDSAYPTETSTGITLLQYYAGQAMVGRISSRDNYGTPEELAEFCFDYARVMVDYENKLNAKG